jgi:hypothetical protein
MRKPPQHAPHGEAHVLDEAVVGEEGVALAQHRHRVGEEGAGDEAAQVAAAQRAKNSAKNAAPSAMRAPREIGCSGLTYLMNRVSTIEAMSGST